jgi:predicted ATPase
MSQQRTGQLSRIVIKGFKSIKECDLDLNNINVFIGSNGAGKSNFISVFALLQSILAQDLQYYAAKKGINTLFYNGAKVTDCIFMEFYFGRFVYSFELEASETNYLIFRSEKFKKLDLPITQLLSVGGNKEAQWKEGCNNLPNDDDGVFHNIRKLQWRVYHFHDTGSTSKIKAEHNI